MSAIQEFNSPVHNGQSPQHNPLEIEKRTTNHQYGLSSRHIITISKWEQRIIQTDSNKIGSVTERREDFDDA